LLTDRDQDGNTPLHQAAISGHSSMLEGLVEWFTGHSEYSKELEINRQNRSGNTPLHLAFQFDHPEIVKFLVEKGAHQDIQNNAELTALEL
ncbi:ankyrin repeat-containing domain protein, partial [Tuber borchii]